MCLAGQGGVKNDEKKHNVLLCFSEFEVGIAAIPYVLCVFLDFDPFLARSQIENSRCFTAKTLCFGPTQGPPKGGPGAPPGGRFETQKSCKSIVFAVYLAMVNPKSL